MRRHPAESSTVPADWYPSYRVVVGTEAEKEQVLNASEYLHWFYVPLTGRSRRARLRHQGECLDSDFFIIGSLMHLYCAEDLVWVDVAAPAPYVLVENDYTLTEMRKGSLYLDSLRIRARGKGTKKPGSTRLLGLDRTEPFIEFFCALHRQPDSLLHTPVPFAHDSRNRNPTA